MTFLSKQMLPLLPFLFFCIACMPTINSERCPHQPRCYCTTKPSGYKVDCTGQHLVTVPGDLPANTDELILNGNPITQLQNDSFVYVPYLWRLLIEQTLLEYIDVMAFANLRYLRILGLRSNKNLNIYSGGLRIGIFKPIGNLTHLLISNNTAPSSVGLEYPTQVIQDLTGLEGLAIDGVSVTPFGPEISKLSKLKDLRFDGIEGMCSLKNITRDFFINIPHLQCLRLIACKIEYIHNYAFKPLYKIRIIDLSFNRKLGFDGFEEGSKGLSNSTIEKLFLNKLYPTFGVGIQLTGANMQWLKNTRLRVLELNSNRLEEIETSTFYTSLPQTITSLSIADNKLTYGYYMWHFNMLTNLQYIDASRMGSSHAIEDSSIGDVDTRCFTSCKRTPSPLGLLTDHRPPHTVQISRHWPAPPYTTFINASHGSLRYKIPEIHATHNRLKRLDLRENTLYSWQGPVTGLKDLEWLDLSNNFCNNVSEYFFDHVPNLNVLYLDNNWLSYSLEEDKRGLIFKNLVNLRKLTLSYNRIEYLYDELFRNLHNLSWLDMSNNRLRKRKLNISFHYMPRLSHLDLRNNFLTELPAPVRDGLDKYGAHIEVLLEGNPWKCTCSKLAFLKWISTTNVRIISRDSLECSLDNCLEKLKNIQQIISFLEKSCRNFTPFILIGCGGLLLSVILTCAMTIYRYRWKLRYFYYVGRAKYQDDGEPSDRTFIYDCFISYAEEDGDFVRSEIRERLEKDAGLKLCLHGRDFIPGKSIPDNVATAIYNSRKCVFILSTEFFDSYWCKFEYNMARVEEMHTGRDILILVSYRYVPTRKIPAEIWEQMEVATYLPYCNTSQEGMNNFWVNLKRALAH